MSWITLYISEVERCNRFIAALDEFAAENGETEDLAILRKQWEAQRDIWQFGVDELHEEMEAQR